MLATSVPPFVWGYRLWYRLASALVVARIRRQAAVEAVYVRGGGARGDVLPMVSDLDFVVFVRDASPEDLVRMRALYAGVARWTRVLDRGLAVHEADRLAGLSRVSRLGYWIAEGKATWRLLHGRDLLAELPELGVADVQTGLVHETRVWWARFAAAVIGDPDRARDAVARNSVSYKAVSAVLAMRGGLEGRGLVFRRAEALALARDRLEGGARDVCLRLELLRRRRFLSDDPALTEASKDLLATQLDGTGSLLRRHELGRELVSVPATVDAPLEEWGVPNDVREHVERLRLAAREAWGSRLRGAHLATGSCFDLDEWALGLRADPGALPPLAALRELHAVHAAAPAGVRSSVHPYLLLDHAALQLDPDEHTKSERAVLYPSAHPEVFELFARPELALEGSPPPRPAAAWTPLAADFLAARTALFLDLLDQRQLHGQGGADFANVFRRALQLVLITRSAGRGEVVHPLTAGALRRAIVREGIDVPAELASAVASRPPRPSPPDPGALGARARGFLDELRGAAATP